MTNQPTLTATRYGLLLAETTCYNCGDQTSTAVIWVGDHQELEDGELVDQDSAALLTYVEWLDERAVGLLKSHTPWLQPASTKASGMTYWANHCLACGSVQGDHFVQGVDGPYWFQDGAAWTGLAFVPGDGPIEAIAGASRSGWMEQVASRYRILP